MSSVDSNGSAHETFDFDGDPSLEPKEMPVKFRGKSYVLREADEGTAIAYRDCFVTKARYSEEGHFSGIGAISNAQAILVSRCLFPVNDAGMPYSFSLKLDDVISWPARVVKPLFNWVVKNSDLREEPDTEEELTKQIESLNRKLAKVRRGKESDPKDTPASTDATSS